MAIQFLDERLSMQSNVNTGTGFFSATPLLIGDIGLQTGAAVDAGNEDSVRVALQGTVGFLGAVEVTATLTLTIERNGTGTAGTGVLIYTETFDTDGSASFGQVSLTAADFPPALAVLANQIRYTLFITSTSDSIGFSGPAVFNGSASAGTTSS